MSDATEASWNEWGDGPNEPTKLVPPAPEVVLCPKCGVQLLGIGAEIDRLKAEVNELQSIIDWHEEQSAESADLETENDELKNELAELESEVQYHEEFAANENEELQNRVAELEDEVRSYEEYGAGEPEEAGLYVGSKIRREFHLPNCRWALEISPYNLIEFDSHDDAVRKGYRPCKTCKA
jgi:gas vesicle protein